MIAAACLLAAGTGLIAVAGDDQPKPKTAFITNNSDPFWLLVEAGAAKAAKEADVDLLFRRPEAGDPAAQKTAIDGVLDQGAKAIAVSVVDPKNETDYLARIEAKVPLVTVGEDAPSSGRVCTIGTDEYEAGRAAGRLVKEALPDGGTIAIFVGDLSPLISRQRRQGVIDELGGKKDVKVEDGATYGKYKLLRTFLDAPEFVERARRNAMDALQEMRGEPNVCMIGLWSYNTPAILAALEDRGQLGKVKVVGFDEDPRTLDGVADGNVVGAIVQDPYQYGYHSVKLLAALAKGDKSKVPAEGSLSIDFRIVTKDGGKEYPDTKHGEKKSIPIKEYKEELKKLLGKE
jgi:ribose transport system substrate-binding protein